LAFFPSSPPFASGLVPLRPPLHFFPPPPPYGGSDFTLMPPVLGFFHKTNLHFPPLFPATPPLGVFISLAVEVHFFFYPKVTTTQDLGPAGRTPAQTIWIFVVLLGLAFGGGLFFLFWSSPSPPAFGRAKLESHFFHVFKTPSSFLSPLSV